MGRLVNRERTNEQEAEGLDALENMNLDRNIDDSNMYDQFNPNAGFSAQPTDIKLKAQNQYMGKETT